MSPEAITAWATVGTTFVIGASAFAALIQLRHMRAGNQLEALLSLERDFRAPELQSALRYVQERLAERMEDPQYRAELATIGFIDTQAHPELIVCNWFNEIGALLKHGLVTEATFMDLFARLIRYCWRLLEPVVAVMRRSRGAYQYHDFEFLAMRAEAWLARNPHGIFPRRAERRVLADPWSAVDPVQKAVPPRAHKVPSE